MNQIIPLHPEYGEGSPVSARELYEFLGFDKANWKRWYEKNILNNPFVIEGVDYQTFFIEKNGNPTKDFAITIDFAKRISMKAEGEKGEKARDYFLDCEKKAIEKNSPKQLTNKELALMVIAEAERAEKAELQLTKTTQLLAEKIPKAEYTEKVLQSDQTYTTSEIAKELDFPSGKHLHQKLKEKKIMYKQSGSWMLYSDYTGKGYTKTRTHTYLDSTEKSCTSTITVWTEAGRQFLHQIFNNTLTFIKA